MVTVKTLIENEGGTIEVASIRDQGTEISLNFPILIAFSCKCRGICPSCGKKRGIIFAETLNEDVLLPVEQAHMVFTIPKRLRAFFRYDRNLNKLLFRSAWESVLELFEEVLPGCKPGCVLSLESSGELLNFNVHLHGLLTMGAFDSNGNFHPLPHIDPLAIQKLFQHKLMHALRDVGLITDTVIAQILSWQTSGFSVWLGEAIRPDDERARLFISQYLVKCPVSLERVSIIEKAGQEIVRYRGDDKTQDFTPLQFLAALQAHIPGVFEQSIRFLGEYSARTRGMRRKNQVDPNSEHDATQLLSPDEILSKRAVSKSWARLIKKVYEIDPLVCPKCGGEMKIKAFITDTLEVARLLKHLGLQGFTKPKPIRATGPPENLFQDLDPLQYV